MLYKEQIMYVKSWITLLFYDEDFEKGGELEIWLGDTPNKKGEFEIILQID